MSYSSELSGFLLSASCLRDILHVEHLTSHYPSAHRTKTLSSFLSHNIVRLAAKLKLENI